MIGYLLCREYGNCIYVFQRNVLCIWMIGYFLCREYGNYIPAFQRNVLLFSQMAVSDNLKVSNMELYVSKMDEYIEKLGLKELNMKTRDIIKNLVLAQPKQLQKDIDSINQGKN